MNAMRMINTVTRKASIVHQARGMATAVTYNSFGNPAGVLKTTNVAPIGSLAPSEVALKFLAAPITSADINMIQGASGLKSDFPAVGGSEGVAVVEQIGSGVKSVNVGDWVLPIKPRIGKNIYIYN